MLRVFRVVIRRSQIRAVVLFKSFCELISIKESISLKLKCAPEWSAVFSNLKRPTERVKSSDKYQITQIILHHSVFVMVCYKSETLTALSYFHYFCDHCYHIFDTRDIENDSLQLCLYFWTTKCYERTCFQKLYLNEGS